MPAQVQKEAPDFSATAVVNEEFKPIKLADYRGKYVVLFFYPLDFTFVCPTEIVAFSDRIKDFHDRGAEVLGCSIDSQFSHLAWTEKAREEGGIKGLAYPLLEDLGKDLADEYNVLAENGKIALRGLFLIAHEGVVQHATINNTAVGRSVDETLRVLQAFQYTQEHGEVCPANWTEGKPTMKADPKGSKEYFGKVNK